MIKILFKTISNSEKVATFTFRLNMPRMIQDFDKDFDELIALIKSKKPFVFSRYADGEHAIIESKPIKGVDGWEVTEIPTLLGKDIKVGLKTHNPVYYYGIPCDCCTPSNENGSLKNYFLEHIQAESKNITFSSLLVNSNYKKLGGLFDALADRPVALVSSGVSDSLFSKLPFKCEILARCPANCMDWNTHKENILNSLAQVANRIFSGSVLIAAGPMAGLIATYLYNLNPTNQYIDVGSSLDRWIFDRHTRDYQIDGNPYSMKKCTLNILTDYNEFSKPKSALSDMSNISVLINCYKRPRNVDRIITSLLGQSLPPQAILTRWNDANSFKDSLLAREFDYLISSKNTGVWSRFHDCIDFSTKYVCVFDDDTIPGSRWLENCMDSINEANGLLGTVGLTYQTARSYWPNRRVGWACPNDRIQQVDIVGHSWFFEKDWLRYFWELRRPEGLNLVGEDIHFSFALQRHGINTYVPPHPPNIHEMWGSLEGSALGTDAQAISKAEFASQRFEVPYNYYIGQGWKILSGTN